MFVPNQLLVKNYKICFRSAQLCTRSTVLALDTRSTVLKFQNNRASKFQNRCSHHSLPIFLEKWQNSSKVTEMNPFLSSTKAKKFFFHQSHNCNPFKITVSSTMMQLPGHSISLWFCPYFCPFALLPIFHTIFCPQTLPLPLP